MDVTVNTANYLRSFKCGKSVLDIISLSLLNIIETATFSSVICLKELKNTFRIGTVIKRNV
jgi:hypothetical protein